MSLADIVNAPNSKIDRLISAATEAEESIFIGKWHAFEMLRQAFMYIKDLEKRIEILEKAKK